jgi:hypothetical protein
MDLLLKPETGASNRCRQTPTDYVEHSEEGLNVRVSEYSRLFKPFRLG